MYQFTKMIQIQLKRLNFGETLIDKPYKNIDWFI